MSRKAIEMVGRTFGVLKVLCECKSNDIRHKNFKVKCLSCGEEMEVIGETIRRHALSNATGCKKCYHPATTHGLSKHKCFKMWDGMLRRCYNKKHEAYHNYGGRGIRVIKQWRDSPKIFIEWLLNHGWESGLEIDRIDNNGNYSPDNCRIATTVENHNNTRYNIHVTINSEKLTIAQAARKYKINFTTIRYRNQIGITGTDLIKPPNTKKYKNAIQN